MHEVIKDLLHLLGLADGQLVGEGGDEGGLAEVGGETKAGNLGAFQASSSQGQKPATFSSVGKYILGKTHIFWRKFASFY